jgi:hypothetical protein
VKLLLFLLTAISAHAESYYVNLNGSDTGNGSQATPWQTIAKVNSFSFAPGDFIYFQGGQTFNGNLSVSAAGTQSQPVTISTYGSGRAVISASFGNGISLNGCSYVLLKNINVLGPGWNLGNIWDDSRGVELYGGSSHCTISGLLVEGFHTAGIHLDQSTHDNWVYKSTAKYNARLGIWTQGINQLIDASIASYNYGDLTVTTNWSGSGIVADHASNTAIQYCEAYGNGSQQPYTGNGPVGIWCWYSDHITIENCISHDNKRGHASSDGGGFDLDGGSNYCVIKNCMSYNNAGPGYMIYDFSWMGITSDNNQIYGNVTQNDAISIFIGSVGPVLASDMIDNNIIVRTDGKAVKDYTGTYGGVTFTGNQSFQAGSLY